MKNVLLPLLISLLLLGVGVSLPVYLLNGMVNRLDPDTVQHIEFVETKDQGKGVKRHFYRGTLSSGEDVQLSKVGSLSDLAEVKGASWFRSSFSAGEEKGYVIVPYIWWYLTWRSILSAGCLWFGGSMLFSIFESWKTREWNSLPK